MSESLDIKEILEVLPHRYPFLLVDKVIELDIAGGTIIAQKNVSMNEAFFQGHFPGMPLMPGVLILEAMAQSGGILVHKRAGGGNRIAVLLNIEKAKFRHPVKPGDTLFFHCEGVHFSDKGGRVNAVARIGERTAAEAVIGFALVENNQI